MIIKHMSMANHLLKNNIRLKVIDRDKTNRSRLIFIFEDSEDLSNALSKFKDYKREPQNDNREENDCKMDWV